MPFNFEYAVNDAETANDYNHNAVSDGDVTRGEYRVQLPDGRTQIVKYTADWKNGYNAEVRAGDSAPDICRRGVLVLEGGGGLGFMVGHSGRSAGTHGGWDGRQYCGC